MKRAKTGLVILRGLLVWALCFTASWVPAGSGTSAFGVFDPRAKAGVPTRAARQVADSFAYWLQHESETQEIYDIEWLIRDAITSAAVATLGTRSPRWEGRYTPQWIRMLNSNELLSYAALGVVTPLNPSRTARPHSPQTTQSISARFEIWDFVANHRIGIARASGPDYDRIGHELAAQTIRMLQLTFATVADVSGDKLLLSIGPEAVTTGDLLLLFAHGEYGKHPSGYPYHEHKEETDHFQGSKIYDRFIREAEQGYGVPGMNGVPFPPKTFPRYKAGDSLFARARRELNATSATLAAEARKGGKKKTEDVRHEVWEKLSRKFDGNPVGLVRIEKFYQPRPYYQHFIAEARVVKGIALPGGFLRKPEQETKPVCSCRD